MIRNCGWILLTFGMAWGQSCETASIKPTPAGVDASNFRFLPGGGLRAVGVPLRLLIQVAYEIQDHQISGAAPWMGSDNFDILAKAEKPSSEAESRKMLQSLLAERFQLK